MSDIIILDNSKDWNNSNHKVTNWKKWNALMDKLNEVFMSFQSLKIKDKVIFYRLSAVMLNSGMTLIKTITTLERQEKNQLLKDIYKNFLVNLKSWKNFSECLSEYPLSFAESEIWMVRSWEKTWKLNDVLLTIAEQVEKISSIVAKLKSALIYPTMIIMVVVWVIVIMMVVVVPKLLDIFPNKEALPASTQLLIALSNFLVTGWAYILTLLVLTFLWISVWIRTEVGKYYFDKFKINIPKFGFIYRKYILSKFARMLSSLISSWVSVVESLKIVSESLNNEVYRQRILLLTEDVKSWIKIWESIDWDPLFPDMMVQMIQVWEQTATLDKTIVKVADFYDEQFEATISTINKLLEPIIIIFLAVSVWFIAIAIMQPIMWLADQISNS